MLDHRIESSGVLGKLARSIKLTRSMLCESLRGPFVLRDDVAQTIDD